MIETLTMEDFAPLRGTTMALQAADAETVAEVLEVVQLASPSPRTAPFTLTLRLPPSSRWPQGIYRLQHPVRGALELFMVPVAQDREGLTFEVVFN